MDEAYLNCENIHSEFIDIFECIKTDNSTKNLKTDEVDLLFLKGEQLEKKINGFTGQAQVKAKVGVTTFSVSKYMIVFYYDEANKDLPFVFRPDMKSAKVAKDKLEKTDMFTPEMNLRIEEIKY